MRGLLKQTIEALKKRVMFNLSIIRNNEQKIREILKEPVSSDRAERLEEKFSTNKEMLKENHDSINLQLNIVQFLDKYKKLFEDYVPEGNENSQKPEPKKADKNQPTIENFEVNEITKDDYFELTIHKGIEYDENHPYFYDNEFYNMLLEYFTSMEDYEMCSKLVAQHKKNDAFLSN